MDLGICVVTPEQLLAVVLRLVPLLLLNAPMYLVGQIQLLF